MNNPNILKIDIRSNNLLGFLKKDELDLLLPHLEEITVERGKVLYEPGDDVKVTYFPCDETLVSFLLPLEEGQTVETALIGREGAVGGIVSQGRVPAYCQAIVQASGKLLCIESINLEEAKMKSVMLRHWFARYADYLLSQIFQSVACCATHTVEQRVAKWLCAALDRTSEHVIAVSQQQLAETIGVGRSYVAKVIGNFKERGALDATRGQLCIRSIDKLKSLSCRCNEQVNHHYESVLGGVYPRDTT